MSTTPVAPVSSVSAAPVAASKPLNAIESIEQELIGFIRQREQAVANVHAVEGAIQATQHLLAKLKAAEAAAAALAAEVVAKVEGAVKAEAKKVVEFVKKEE